MEKAAMTLDIKGQRELETAIRASVPLEEIVSLLRRYKQGGATREDVYAFLTSLRDSATDEATEDRVVEVADFVAGFCSPHMRVWEN
jgi:hypothetical protein